MKQVTEKIARMLEKVGFGCQVSGSGLSSSQYVIASHDEIDTIKIRISDHELPPTYANNNPSNYEVGENNNYSCCQLKEWFIVVKIICDKHNMNYPSTLKSMITRAKNEAERVTMLNESYRIASEKKEIACIDSAMNYFNEHKDNILKLRKDINETSGKQLKKLKAKFQKLVPLNHRIGIKLIADRVLGI